VLHPPYTAWHLSYVVLGASLAPRVDISRMVGTVLAFFLAVGVAAHCLDELHGRPLRTLIPGRALIAATVVSLLGAVAIGVAGLSTVGAVLVPFIVVGPLLVMAYNAELLGGIVHTDAGFAAAWGAFPVLVAYYVQAGRLDLTAAFAAAATFGISLAQRSLSTPARTLRRRVAHLSGEAAMHDGRLLELTVAALLEPLERALRALSWAMVALAAALLADRVF